MNLILDDKLPFAEKILLRQKLTRSLCEALALSKMMLQVIAEAAPPESVLYQRALKASLKVVISVFEEVIKNEVKEKN